MHFDDRPNGDERICTAPPPIKSGGGKAIWEYTVGVPKKNTRTTPDRVTVSFRDTSSLERFVRWTHAEADIVQLKNTSI